MKIPSIDLLSQSNTLTIVCERSLKVRRKTHQLFRLGCVVFWCLKSSRCSFVSCMKHTVTAMPGILGICTMRIFRWHTSMGKYKYQHVKHMRYNRVLTSNDGY